MASVSIRDLAIAKPALSADVLLERWRKLPDVDAAKLRAETDEIIDSRL